MGASYELGQIFPIERTAEVIKGFQSLLDLESQNVLRQIKWNSSGKYFEVEEEERSLKNYFDVGLLVKLERKTAEHWNFEHCIDEPGPIHFTLQLFPATHFLWLILLTPTSSHCFVIDESPVIKSIWREFGERFGAKLSYIDRGHLAEAIYPNSRKLELPDDDLICGFSYESSDCKDPELNVSKQGLAFVRCMSCGSLVSSSGDCRICGQSLKIGELVKSDATSDSSHETSVKCQFCESLVPHVSVYCRACGKPSLPIVENAGSLKAESRLSYRITREENFHNYCTDEIVEFILQKNGYL